MTKELPPDGLVCDRETNRCLDALGMDCEAHSDCDQGLCLDGRCHPIECALDSHCAENETCRNERCESRVQGCNDVDGDGYGEGFVCLDSIATELDPNVNAGVIENQDVLCSDGIDHDCDGRDPICGDFDQDGDGYTVEQGDCDDERADVHPARSETPYNGRDDDCNPATSDDDVDGDGFRAQSVGGSDCDDANPEVDPGVDEVPGNAIFPILKMESMRPPQRMIEMETVSQNSWEIVMMTIHQFIPVQTKCPIMAGMMIVIPVPPTTISMKMAIGWPRTWMTTMPVNPGQRELFYNGVDDDCNPDTVDNDVDGDGYRGSDVMGSDCNDRSSSVNSNAVEIPYNGIDDDCDPETPDDDIDGDGVPRAEDCDDNNSEVNPNVIENNRDNCGDGIDHVAEQETCPVTHGQ